MLYLHVFALYINILIVFKAFFREILMPNLYAQNQNLADVASIGAISQTISLDIDVQIYIYKYLYIYDMISYH